MEVKTIGVLGAGTMGSGIAQVAAQAGYNVIMRDITEQYVQAGFRAIDRFLSKSVEKGKMAEQEKHAVMGRITGTVAMADLAVTDFLIEAITENMDLKKQAFEELDALLRRAVVLATNTSSMSITEIAGVTARPERVVGMHFFHPTPLMRLVEVVRGFNTSDETVRAAMAVARSFGKEPIEVKRDSPGFLVNRLMLPHFIEAIRLFEDGVASKEDIDKAAKLGLNYPMGPFEIMDQGGIDIFVHVTNYLLENLNTELKWVVPRPAKDLLKAGRLGRKTGAGWYDYA
jgi:3-hydroxybutyryl-CoA dehydrogenase